MKHLLNGSSGFLLMCLLSATQLNGQQFSIALGSITTCTGVLEDTGGPAGQYGNNENVTAVICPDVPGDAITLFWAVFDLSTAGPNPIDRLRIWDGNSTAGTFLGEYNGTDLQGLTVAATTFNPTGCLTVQFISNANGTGNFAATIQCFTPCDRPTAVASIVGEVVPALVCVGETVSFDGTLSYAAPGFTITSFTWDFDDGTTASGPTASHAFAEPGEYIVQLNLVDDNNCVNSNVVDLQVLVSTTPSFQGTLGDLETCVGASVDLNGVVTPTTWTGIPEANFGDGIYLPDDVGTPFTSELVFTQFNPGQVVMSTGDILSVCVSMEHSFMGDLVLSLTCPNGQSIIFHQQGGAGTYIGGANDMDGNLNPVPGTCWDYCWSPTATNGTWVQAVAAGQTMPGGTPPNQALIPGTYSSVQPFTNLIGCPLNGTWTFTSLDLWGADNGFLCNWSINFNPAIIPDVTTFTPVIGTSTLDSAWWSGPFLTLNPANPLVATATPTAPGTYPYTLTVVDNFGCTYDTTITVEVFPLMVIDAGPPITLCNDPVPMAGQVVANGPPANCVWLLQLNETFGDGWNGGANLAVTINGVTTNYSITTFGTLQEIIPLNVTTGQTITLTYTAGTIWNNENSFLLTNDLGVVVYQSPQGPSSGVAYSATVVCGGGIGPVVWQWTPATGLANPSSPTTTVYTTQPTWYYLSAYPTGWPACLVTDSVLVSPDPSINAGANNAIVLCSSEPAFLMTDSLNGTPDPGGVWTTSGGAVVPNLFDPMTGASGTYTYTVTSPAGCVATAQLDITIIPASDPVCCGVADAGQPSYSCNLTIELSATPGNTGVGQWTGPPGAVFADASSPTTTVTMPPGSGGTHTFYWIEDDNAFCYLIDSVQKTFTDAIVIAFTTTDAVCYTYCDGTVATSITGGNAAAGFQYAWSTGSSQPGGLASLCAGQYSLTVTDDNGCTGSGSFVIGQPVLLEIDAIASLPATCFEQCDGSITVTDAEAVAYSFDGGASWSASGTAQNVCAGQYSLQIQNAAGCIGTGSVTVTEPPLVVAEFEWRPIPANVNDPTIFFTNTSQHAGTYLWDFGGLGTSTEVNPAFNFPYTEPGQYLVCLTAWNSNLCVDTVCHTVIIDDVLFTYVPNAFTPDGDGVNELFFMSTNIDVITDFRMLIFDRWGQEIFGTNDPYEPWRGSYQNSGEILPPGVYAYKIDLEIKGTQARRELRGHVTLIR